MEITTTATDDKLTVEIEGRLDAGSAPALTQTFSERLVGIVHLILDFDGVEYVSSAGLRALLIAQKQMNKQGDMVVRHVTPSVMEVFDMTGFSDILTIEKTAAIREIELDSSKMLGRGANGAVYQYKEDSIVKLYFRDSALEEIEREKKMAREALILGIPTAISLGIVMSDGKYGLEYEFIQSNTMSGEMMTHPEKWDILAAQFVELTQTLHNTPHKIGRRGGQFPAARDMLLELIDGSSNGTPELRARCIAFINAIPEGNTLVHGDFHPGNVMLSGDEPLIIDIADLSYGHPLFDLAFVYRALHLFEVYFGLEHPEDVTVAGLSCAMSHTLWDYFFQHYFAHISTQEARNDILEQIQLLALIHGYFFAHRAPVPLAGPITAMMDKMFQSDALERHTGTISW